MTCNFAAHATMARFRLLDICRLRDQLNSTSEQCSYHNNRHMDFVLEDCIEWYLTQYALGQHVPEDQARTLFYAAIFHDANHSGGELPDSANIKHAIAAWELAASSMSVSDSMCNNVATLIQATEYPSAYLEMEQLARVLRDADLMTIYHGDEGREMLSWNLYQEFQQHKGLQYNDYMAKEMSFLANVQWNTAWGGEKAEALRYDELRTEVSLRMGNILTSIHVRERGNNYKD